MDSENAENPALWMVYSSVTSNRHTEIKVKSPGRPRKPSAHVIAGPLAAFIDANWDKTGLTNEEGAAHFGILAPNMISHWRTGRSPLKLAHVPKMAKLLGTDETTLFVLWLKQQRLRDQTIPANLVELLEQRLVSANEATLVNAVRSATRNSDPTFNSATIAAVAGAVAP